MDMTQSLLLFSAFIHVCSSAWQWLDKRNDKTQERIAELTKQVEQLEKDISALKANAESAPSHADLARVYESLNEQAEKLNQLVGENRGQSDTLRLILNQIMQKGMK